MSHSQYQPNNRTLPEIIHEINEYIDRQTVFIQEFQNMMLELDPKESTDPVEMEYCQSQLNPLMQRYPPNIHGEISKEVLHMAIRQSKHHSELAIALLRQGYINAKSQPWMTAWNFALAPDGAMDNSEEMLWKRYHIPQRYQVIQNMPRLPTMGTIIMYDPHAQESLVTEYHRDVRTNCSNAPAQPFGMIRPATVGSVVHVAMGFNDLQILLEHFDNVPMNDSSSSANVPMKFIGYDRSTYSIAKTLVLSQMLQQPAVTPHHIIEAWYSSTWNYETFMLFRYACITLLKDDAYVNQQQQLSVQSYAANIQKEIRGYLYHWAYDAVPITAVEAIQRWLCESAENDCYALPCSFHRRNDRKSLLQYLMTGEFNSQNKSQSSNAEEMVGSLTMWSVPDWAPDTMDQDLVFFTITFQSILEDLNNHHPSDEITVMDIMYQIKLRQVTNLQRAVQRNELQIDIRYGDIQPLHLVNPYLVDEIRDLNAETMSWSNLVDYFEVDKFHELAHHLSHKNNRTGMMTNHYGYTMNWPTTCFGTSVLDYMTKKERQQIVFDTLASAKNESDETGVGKLITMPIFTDVKNLTSEILCRQFRSFWLDYFLKESQKILPTNAIMVVTSNDMLLNHSPLYRSNLSIYLTWTYVT